MAALVRIEDLIYDWNVVDRSMPKVEGLQFDDETLRDGLQSPSAVDPPVEKKIEILHLMDALGIDTVNLGLPGAGARPREDILRMAREISDNRLRIRANVACRTVVSDIEPVVELSQRAGLPIEVCAFIGSSQIRQYTEDWQLETMLDHTRKALSFCRQHDLPVMYVTEDTTRAFPDTLRGLYSAAIDLGARRLCVCDTVGHATRYGATAVVRFVKEQIVDKHDPSVGIDWHGHMDRNLGIANSIAAIQAGATRVHGTALGIGERAGNTPMDQMLVNARLKGWIDRDLTMLPKYVRTVAEAIEVPIPHNYAVLGPDAFETGTGVHAAAVIKAMRKGDVHLANSVYSGVPAHLVGLEQAIGIGPMSGKSNVIWCLERLGIEPTEERIQRVLQRGKVSKRLMSDEQIRAAAE